MLASGVMIYGLSSSRLSSFDHHAALFPSSFLPAEGMRPCFSRAPIRTR